MPTSAAQRIYERSLRNAIHLRALEEPVLRRVLQLLAGAQADILRKIEARLERLGPIDAQISGRGLDTTRKLQKLYDELDATTRAAYAEVQRDLERELSRLARRVAGIEAGMFEAILPFSFSATRPNTQLLRSIVTSRPFEGRLLSQWTEKLGEGSVSRLVNELELGLVQGETIPQLVTRVRGAATGVRHTFEWKGKSRWYREFRGGIFDTDTRHATALVRTATMHVYAHAREAFWAENDDLLTDEILWISVLDELTSKICQERDHKRYHRTTHEPIGHDLPYLQGPGRAHYGGCRSVGIPFIKAAAALGRAGFDVSGLTPGERQAMGGPLPATLDYSDFLHRQDLETQALALRSGRRARWFREHPEATVDEAWAIDFRRAAA